jgi:hypothetical protein
MGELLKLFRDRDSNRKNGVPPQIKKWFERSGQFRLTYMPPRPDCDPASLTDRGVSMADFCPRWSMWIVFAPYHPNRCLMIGDY